MRRGFQFKMKSEFLGLFSSRRALPPSNPIVQPTAGLHVFHFNLILTYAGRTG